MLRKGSNFFTILGILANVNMQYALGLLNSLLIYHYLIGAGIWLILCSQASILFG